MSIPMNRASSVEMTLLNRILAVNISAVGVDTEPGYSILSPPAVHRTRLGLAFCGRWSATMRRYVAFFPRGSSDQWTKAIVREGTLALFPTLPSVSLPISSMLAWMNWSLIFVFIKSRYSSMAPVSGWITAFATWSRLGSGEKAAKFAAWWLREGRYGR